MIKRLLAVIMLTLAVNFLAAAGGIAWLWNQGKLNREKVTAIKEIVFKQAQEQAPTSQPSGDPTTQPIVQLDDLLAKASGRSATEQVEFIQQNFDAQVATLDRRRRELNDLQQQVELAKQQMSRDRAALDAREKGLAQREQQATKLEGDKGFQDSLSLYKSMPPKQVKTIFMGLDDATMTNYLQAMDPRAATKIIKEFKSTDETTRIQKILERMRQASASSK
jgi:hypothetical protein